jgi:hypothetical protein
VLVLTDIFSKFMWTQAQKSKKANETEELISKVYARHGPFVILQSDHGGEFVNELVTAFSKAHNIGLFIFNICLSLKSIFIHLYFD